MVALRALVRSRSIAIVLSLLTLLGTTGTWHADDDPDCAPPAAAHDHSRHHEQLRAATHAVPPAHCAICHWLQAFRSDAVRQLRVPLAADGRCTQVRAPLQAVRSAEPLALPSRAPPTA